MISFHDAFVTQLSDLYYLIIKYYVIIYNIISNKILPNHQYYNVPRYDTLYKIHHYMLLISTKDELCLVKTQSQREGGISRQKKFFLPEGRSFQWINSYFKMITEINLITK